MTKNSNKIKMVKSLVFAGLMAFMSAANAGFDWEGADEPAPEQPPHQITESALIEIDKA